MRPIDADALIDSVKNIGCASVSIETRKIVDETLHELVPKIIDEEPTLDEFEYKGLTIRQWANKITSGEYQDEGISAKDVCKEMAKLFGSPCNYSPMDEIMLKNEECEKVCDKQTDEECWYRFFVYKLKEGD